MIVDDQRVIVSFPSLWMLLLMTAFRLFRWGRPISTIAVRRYHNVLGTVTFIAITVFHYDRETETLRSVS